MNKKRTQRSIFSQVERELCEYASKFKGNKDVEITIHAWNRCPQPEVGLRISEISFIDVKRKNGFSYMQSDVPTSLGVCAAVERYCLSIICNPLDNDELKLDRDRMMIAFFGDDNDPDVTDK